MIKTFKQLQEIDTVVGELYAKDKSLEKSKFGWAYKRFMEKNYVPAVKELNEKLEEARINNCLEDKVTREIMRDEKGSYKFSKDGFKNLLVQHKEIKGEFEQKEFECEPFISPFVPELTDEERETLSGVVI